MVLMVERYCLSCSLCEDYLCDFLPDIKCSKEIRIDSKLEKDNDFMVNLSHAIDSCPVEALWISNQ